jgi:putative ABC transport system substrate-binding protein
MKYGKTILVAILVLMSVLPGAAYARDGNDTCKIAVLLWAGVDGFKAQMTEFGYVEGENVTYMSVNYENVPPEEFQAEYEKQIKAMVANGVDVIVADTDSEAVNLRNLIGSDIPVVFARSDDPVATGAVADLVRPGGNATGVVTNKPHERRVQLLTEIKPTTKKVYYISSIYLFATEVILQQIQAVADGLGVEIVATRMTMDAESEMEAAKNIPEDADWVLISPYAFFDEASTEVLMTFTAEHQIAMCFVTSDPAQGYVISYGPDMNATSAQAAVLVDRILRGASPAELPTLIAENFMTINLEAAEAIDLDIPQSILRQADLIVRPGYFDNLANSGN